MNKRVLLLTWLLLCIFSGNAQTSDPLLDSILLKENELGNNVFIWSERPTQIFSATGQTWNFWTQRLVVESTDGTEEALLSFTITYGYYPDAPDLAASWNALRNDEHPRPIIPSEEASFSQIAEGVVPHYIRYVKNNAIISISMGRSRDPQKFSSAEVEALFSLIIEKLDGKLSSLPSGESFDVEFLELTTENAIQVEGAVSNPSLEYSVQGYLLRQDQPEEITLEIQNLSTEGKFIVSSGTLPEGDYQLKILVFDFLGRSYSFQKDLSVNVAQDNVSISSAKDSTLVSKKPHQNEGLNSRLTLEKINGKATRTAVGFDLVNQNLNGLTSATLVLSIDSDSGVNGWGNGETVEALPLSADWLEGNGQSFGLKKRDEDPGSGAGVTWFSPIDENISNDSANSVTSWNGGQTTSGTAPVLTVQNHQSGTLEFDVTNDVLNGADSWLIRKTLENRGSKVTFFSKENGDLELAPKLLLDYGGQVSQSQQHSNNLLSALGFTKNRPMLELAEPKSELPTIREILQKEPLVAFVGESFLVTASGQNPLVSTATKVAYRAWLS